MAASGLQPAAPQQEGHEEEGPAVPPPQGEQPQQPQPPRPPPGPKMQPPTQPMVDLPTDVVSSWSWAGEDRFSDLGDRRDAPPLPLPGLGGAAKRVVLVRHGQSTWNARNRIQVRRRGAGRGSRNRHERRGRGAGSGRAAAPFRAGAPSREQCRAPLAQREESCYGLPCPGQYSCRLPLSPSPSSKPALAPTNLGCLQGSSDFSVLTDTGYKQAGAAGKLVRAPHPTYLAVRGWLRFECCAAAVLYLAA